LRIEAQFVRHMLLDGVHDDRNGFKRERIGSMIQARYYQINPECQKPIAQI
jgi:hypothetical protein